jgi:DNA adenine methylase
VTQYVSGDRTASDINKALITTFTALQKGWIPPKWITRQEHTDLRNNMDCDNPLTAIGGIIYSFGGAWFHAYMGEVYPDRCRMNALLKKIPLVKDVTFRHCTYLDYDPHDMIIYCDPPYAKTFGYKSDLTFDHIEFWNTMRNWTKDNIVLISEWEAPSDFRCVLAIQSRMTFTHHSNSTPKIERVFTLNDPPERIFEWPEITLL